MAGKWEIMGRMGVLGEWEHRRQGNAFDAAILGIV